MRKFLKICCITGLCLLLAGGLCFVIGWGATGFQLSALSNVKVEMFHYVETENANIQTINIDYDVSDVEVVFGDQLKIDYPKRYKKNGKLLSDVTIKEDKETGELTIKERSRFTISIVNFSDETLTLTLPQDRMFTLNIKTDTGDVYLPSGGKYESLKIETDTGDISVQKSDCALGLDVEVETGDVKISEFTGKYITVETDTGDVSVNHCTVLEKISLETDTGAIKTSGTVKTTDFFIEVSTGDVRLKDVLDADTVFIKTNTGDVSAVLKGKQSHYKISVDTNTGDCNIGNTSEGDRRLTIDTNTGDVKIQFVE